MNKTDCLTCKHAKDIKDNPYYSKNTYECHNDELKKHIIERRETMLKESMAWLEKWWADDSNKKAESKFCRAASRFDELDQLYKVFILKKVDQNETD